MSPVLGLSSYVSHCLSAVGTFLNLLSVQNSFLVFATTSFTAFYAFSSATHDEFCSLISCKGEN